MRAEQFAEEFRDEHRYIRDALLALVDAFQNNDAGAIRAGIDEIAAEAGPHFQYEGEALYPALTELFGDGYVNQLRAEQELALATARELAGLADVDELTPEVADYGVELIRALLPHVSDRDGLSVIIEVLEPEQVASILAAREQARKGKIGLREAGKRAGRRAATAKGKARASRASARGKRSARKQPRKAARRRARTK